jgi:hypothetical protein
MTDKPPLPPRKIAALKRQLKNANDRLLAIARRRETLKADVAALKAQLENR